MENSKDSIQFNHPDTDSKSQHGSPSQIFENQKRPSESVSPSPSASPAPSPRAVGHKALSRRVKILGAAGIIVILVVCILFFSRHNDKNKNRAGTVGKNPPAIPVNETEARKGSMGVYIEALGTVTPVNTVNAISRVQGQVTAVNFREGQMVKKGDSLVEIDPRPYEAAVLQAEGALAHDQGLLREAKIDLNRYRLAYAKRAISKQQFEDQEQVVLQDEGTVKADQGTLANAQLNVSYCHITSAIDGRAGLRLVDVGNMVQANSTTPLVVITQLQPITVIFSVAEDYISQIQDQLKPEAQASPDAQSSSTSSPPILVSSQPLALPAPMIVDAYDRSQQKKLASGTFLTLDNQVDPTTGTVKVRAVFPNEDSMLFPNQFVNARLLVTTQKDSTLISSAAIQKGVQGSFVYVVKADNTVEMRPIKIGTSDGVDTAVEGVHPDEKLVSNGFDKLQEGSKVAVQQDSSQSPATGANPNHELAGQAAR